MKRLFKKGFTLVELVVVIAIIAILSGVGVAVYIGVTNNAKKTADSEIIAQLNLQMKAKQAEEGKNSTCYGAYEDAFAIGFDLNNLKPQSGGNYVWDQDADLFAQIDANGALVNGDKGYSLPTEAYKLWKFTKTVDSASAYSQYLTNKDELNSVTVVGGFDCGKNGTVKEVNYSNTTANVKNVILRTNSTSTTLNVVDQSDSKIYQYDECGIINSTVGMNSLYVKGDVGVIEVKDHGHVVVDGSVEFVYTSIEDTTKILVEGNVEHAHATSEAVATALNVKTPSVHWDYTEDGTERHPEGWTVEAEKYEIAPAATEENLRKADNVCHINGKGFDTVANGLKEADQKTLVLLKDSNETGLAVAAGKTTTIDLNGFSFTNKNRSFNQYVEGNITFIGEGVVEEFRIAGSASITFDDLFVGRVNRIVYCGGNLVIKGGTYSKSIVIDDGASYKPNTYVLRKFVPVTHTRIDVNANDEKVILTTEELAVATVTKSGVVNYFDTLSNAFIYAIGGGTITLTKDVACALSGNASNYYANGDVILDLNGHTWDLLEGNTVHSTGIRLYSGNLTVKTSKDGGKIVPSSSGCRVFEIEGGTLTVESGNYYDATRGGTTITGSNGNGCKGTVTINGGTFGTIYANSVCSSITINGGTFNGTITTAYNSNTVVNIAGGKFYSQICCNQSATGTFNISGGDFYCFLGNGGTFNISGGNFNSFEEVSLYGSILAKNSNTSFTLTGGTYGEDVTTNTRVTIPSGYHWDATTKTVVKD